MGVDHRRFDILIAKKFLDGWDIVTTFKQVPGNEWRNAL